MLTVGDIAFIGINTAGGPDDWVAFVTLAPITAGSTIYFSDNELTSASATTFNTGESYSKWTATSDVAAGTVITLTNFDIAGGPLASTGTASVVTFSGSSNRGFSQTADSVYAYTAASDATADTPLLHLARINLGNAQDGFAPASLPADLAIGFVEQAKPHRLGIARPHGKPDAVADDGRAEPAGVVPAPFPFSIGGLDPPIQFKRAGRCAR